MHFTNSLSLLLSLAGVGLAAPAPGAAAAERRQDLTSSLSSLGSLGLRDSESPARSQDAAKPSASAPDYSLGGLLGGLGGLRARQTDPLDSLAAAIPPALPIPSGVAGGGGGGGGSEGGGAPERRAVEVPAPPDYDPEAHYAKARDSHPPAAAPAGAEGTSSGIVNLRDLPHNSAPGYPDGPVAARAGDEPEEYANGHGDSHDAPVARGYEPSVEEEGAEGGHYQPEARGDKKSSGKKKSKSKTDSGKGKDKTKSGDKKKGKKTKGKSTRREAEGVAL